MVQQQLENLQMSFQKQIVALRLALGASINPDSTSMNSTTPSILPMYSEKLITSFPTLTTANYLFGSMGNSTCLIEGEKLND